MSSKLIVRVFNETDQRVKVVVDSKQSGGKLTNDVIDPNCSKYFVEGGPYVVRVPDKCYSSNTLVSSYSFIGKLGKPRLCEVR